jgi:hypothetical protein
MRLPIRLVHERQPLSAALDWAGMAIFLLLFGGFVVNGMIIRQSDALLKRFDQDPRPTIIIGCLIVAVVAVMLFFVLRLTLEAVLESFPGSPYYYTEISGDGIAMRDGWRPRQYFPWGDLSAFAVGERHVTLRGGDKVKEPWVVAFAGANAAMPDDRAMRYKRAALRIDPKFYAAGKPDTVNKAFAAWLNAIRDQARSGSVEAVIVPEMFRESAVGLLPGSGEASL